jgi:hypothetical protein
MKELREIFHKDEILKVLQGFPTLTSTNVAGGA